jgi:uncharacterized phage protein (TIGR01671 family)
MEEVMIQKYQVWDGKRMHEVESINLSENMPGGIHHVVVRRGEHGVDTLFQSVHGVPDGEFEYDLKLRQFTGLKDKNGKEIYEKDLVLIYDKQGNRIQDEPFQVDWIENDEYGYNIGYGLFPNTFDYRIISNCFENPELLKE